jgi:hypothetical protein
MGRIKGWGGLQLQDKAGARDDGHGDYPMDFYAVSSGCFGGFPTVLMAGCVPGSLDTPTSASEGCGDGVVITYNRTRQSRCYVFRPPGLYNINRLLPPPPVNPPHRHPPLHRHFARHQLWVAIQSHSAFLISASPSFRTCRDSHMHERHHDLHDLSDLVPEVRRDDLLVREPTCQPSVCYPGSAREYSLVNYRYTAQLQKIYILMCLVHPFQLRRHFQGIFAPKHILPRSFRMGFSLAKHLHKVFGTDDLSHALWFSQDVMAYLSKFVLAGLPNSTC